MITLDKPIAVWIEEARDIIYGSLDSDEVRAAVAKFNYDEERLKKGKELFDRAETLYRGHIDEWGAAYGATDVKDELFEKMEADYERLSDLARVALKNDRDALHDLKLPGGKERSMPLLMDQMRTFADNAAGSPKIREALSLFGVTKKELEDFKKSVEAVDSSLKDRTVERAEAVAATRERNKAFEKLRDWLNDYRAILKIAGRDDPSVPKTLGM